MDKQGAVTYTAGCPGKKLKTSQQFYEHGLVSVIMANGVKHIITSYVIPSLNSVEAIRRACCD